MIDIKAMRKNRGLTQERLGKLLGVNQKRVARIESNPDTVSFGQIKKIVVASGYELSCHADENYVPKDGDNMRGYVYILAHESIPIIKIGLAQDVVKRAESFTGVSLAYSHRLAFDEYRDAMRVERMLHRAFHKWRIEPTHPALDGVAADGRTEWFHADCRDRVFKFIRDNRDIIGSRIEPVLFGASAIP